MSSTSETTLVIPAHNEQEHLGPCLDAVVPLLEQGHLAEILVVDDGSTDDTAEVAAARPGVRVIRGEQRGAGAARNLGFRSAETPLVWFVDADCVAEPDALPILQAHMEDPEVAGVGGSYGNMRPESLLASVIHEEIVERHARMAEEVNFLATFNVLYRKSALEQVGGFDERFRKGQDAELAYRIRRDVGRLRFDMRSRVKHFHEESLRQYLKVQRQQGYWRVWLYAEHPEHAGGDSYSSHLDHVQPVLAVLALGLAPTIPLGIGALLEAPVLAGLAAAPAPMARQLMQRTGDTRMLAYIPISMVRSFSRGLGLAEGTLSVARQRLMGAAK